MACADDYEAYKDPEFDSSDEEEEQHRKTLTDLGDTFALEKSFREESQRLKVREFFNWEPVKPTVVVIGIGKGIDSEFAFQRKCQSIVYRCYIYNAPT